MSMMWVKRQSKWLIVAAALLIGGSLIMMDLPAANGMSGSQSVGEVNGEEISAVSFQQDLQNMLRDEEARTGRQPAGADFVQARENLFQFRVQNLILGRMIRDYGLRATVEEMQDWLLRNPRDIGYSLAQYEGPQSVPYFLNDSTQDPGAFRNWLAQDSVYDRPGMRVLEQRLKTMVIPQLQVQEIFRAQVHRTDLEEAFLLETREDKAALRYYHVSAASFPVDAGSFSEAELKAHFEANPDSFWHADEAARLAYVRIPLQPSAADTALMRDFAAEIRERAEGGESFEELARSYSSDAGSAEKGGRLPPTARAEWVPAFADAAFALAPGQISQPVLSPFGYHLIQMHAVTKVDGVEKAEVSHILLNITTGTETMDSALAAAEVLQDQAAESGLEAAAKSAGLTVAKTPVFQKGTVAPLGVYVQGAASFAFNPAERKAVVSEPLQNEEGIYILARDAKFPKGRDFARSREAVAASLARTRQFEAAQAEATRVRTALLAAGAAEPAPNDGKAVLATTDLISSEGFAPGFGFGSASLFQAVHQKPGEWGPVLTTPEGAVVAQVLVSLALPAAEKAQRIQAARAEGDMFQASNLYQQWAQQLPKMAKVKNNLEMIYRD
jgi:peptidyl-prolyl cis-trans isomerase D